MPQIPLIFYTMFAKLQYVAALPVAVWFPASLSPPRNSKNRLSEANKRFCRQGRLLLLVFALLIRNTAGGLAGRLAGSLALAAAAGNGALGQVTGLNGLDSVHVDALTFPKNS